MLVDVNTFVNVNSYTILLSIHLGIRKDPKPGISTIIRQTVIILHH